MKRFKTLLRILGGIFLAIGVGGLLLPESVRRWGIKLFVTDETIDYSSLELRIAIGAFVLAFMAILLLIAGERNADD